MVKRPPLTGAEKMTLRAFLDKQRDVMLWKLSNASDEELRRPMTASGTSLLGMLKHLAGVEYGWFCTTFGRATEPMPFDEDDEEADLRIEPGDTTAGVLAFYARARAAADRIIDETDLDDTGTAWTGETVSMRWVLLHMIEETARHAGHADIIREALDGTTGYVPEDYLPGHD